MRLILTVILCLALPTGALTGSETPKKDPLRTAAAGSADAAVAFARQAGQVATPTGPEPTLVGAYVWGGRADENYKPFFQWEFRVVAGNAAVSGLKLRTVTLMPDRSPAGTSPWVTVGDLGAGAKKDVSVRQNCSAFSSYQVEGEWQGGKAVWMCSDKTAVPVAQSLNAERAYLITTAYDHDPDSAKKPFLVTWWLWNVGGLPATEVVQTVKFLDDAGKEVHSETVTLKDPVPGGGALQQKLSLKQRPKGYKAVSVSATCADAVVGSGPGDAGFTGATDLEIAGIAVAKGALTAQVRNGLGKELVGAVVTVTLQDANGKPVESIKLPCGTLAVDEVKSLSAPTTAKGFAGYEVSWTVEQPAAPAPMSASPTSDDAPAAPIAPVVIKVRGLEFTQTQGVVEDGTLYVKGELTNRTGRDLTALKATFTTGSAATVYASELLAADATVLVSLALPGVAQLDRLAMMWTAK